MFTYQLSCRLIWEEATQSPSHHRREGMPERGHDGERERAAEGGRARGERDAREGAERERGITEKELEG